MKKISNMLVISIVCAILAAFVNVISPLPWAMLVCGMVGSIFALISLINVVILRKDHKDKENKKALELSIVAFALNMIIIFIFLGFMIYFCTVLVRYM